MYEKKEMRHFLRFLYKYLIHSNDTNYLGKFLFGSRECDIMKIKSVVDYKQSFKAIL